MMKKVFYKESLLIVLIITSIIQTGMLWLGGSPSHNFLESKPIQVTPILPENIWRNTGDPFTVSYRVDYKTSEYDRLVRELQEMLGKYTKGIKVQESESLDWAKILSMQGILYEYAIPVSLDELATSKLGLSEVGFIDNVFLNMADSMGSKVKLYLINDAEDVCYKAELSGDFGDLTKIYSLFNIEEMGVGLTKYQPSTKASNISPYLEGNVFLPLSGEDMPIKYEPLRFINPIEAYEEHKQIILDKYTNEFFTKPILKDIDYRTDGSVVFTESMKSIVMYKPSGILEYINLDVSRSEKVMSMLDGYNVALDFIEKTHTLSQAMKQNIYLDRIVQTGREYTFYFDLRYDGYKVVLTEEAKTQMGVEHMIELTIKDYQLIGGKWSIRELVVDEDMQGPIVRELPVSYSEPINKMYTGLPPEMSIPRLEDVQVVYVIEDIDRQMDIKWGVFYEEMWYYP